MAYDVYRITIKGHLDPEWSDWFVSSLGKSYLLRFGKVSSSHAPSFAFASPL
jgi:hypothetical protein